MSMIQALNSALDDLEYEVHKLRDRRRTLRRQARVELECEPVGYTAPEAEQVAAL